MDDANDKRCWYGRYSDKREWCRRAGKWKSVPGAIHDSIGFVWCDEHKHDDDVLIDPPATEATL